MVGTENGFPQLSFHVHTCTTMAYEGTSIYNTCDLEDMEHLPSGNWSFGNEMEKMLKQQLHKTNIFKPVAGPEFFLGMMKIRLV